MGVAFLDEVAELDPQAQVTLLRAIWEHKVRPLGGREDEEAFPRIVSATHKDIKALTKTNEFRLDLYYRLLSAVIELPPLRDCKEDIVVIVADEMSRQHSDVASEVWGPVLEFLKQVKDYHWPGNVRELCTAVQALSLGLPPVLSEDGPPYQVRGQVPADILDGKWTLRRVMQWYVRRVVEQEGSQAGAAKRLDIVRNTVARHLAAGKDKDG